MKLDIITLFLSILPLMKSYDFNYDYDTEEEYGTKRVWCNYENSCLGGCIAYRHGNSFEETRLGTVIDKEDFGALIIFDWRFKVASEISEMGANVNVICSDEESTMFFNFQQKILV